MSNKTGYDPQKHHRKSIRLKGYDYSQVGAYFVTICINQRECLYGKVVDGEMHLNEAGLMIDTWWQKIPEKFHDIELGEYQIMPNHFHAVIINVGADPRVCPDTQTETDKLTDAGNLITDETDVEHLIFGSSLHEGEHVGLISANNIKIQGEHMGSPLHKVVQWFKTMTTNDYIRNVKQNGWPSFNKKLWQRNYFEHIIRKDKSFQLIANYIYNNPANWENDKFFVA